MQAELKSVELRLEIPQAPPSVSADRHSVLQVFFNLLDTPIKFTPEGDRASMGCAENDNSVRFAVSDTGLGIRTGSFEKFRAVLAGEPAAHIGSGIGLAVAKAIIEQPWRGNLGPEQPGVGPTFFHTSSDDAKDAVDPTLLAAVRPSHESFYFS